MGALSAFTLRRRVRRLAIRLDVEALGLENRIARSAGEQEQNYAIAIANREIAARIREVLDNAEQ
jgi:hypothetical protein